MLNISGIPVEVYRKNIKNVHLHVKPPDGAVSVTAPMTMSDGALERLVLSKIDWIKKQTARFEGRPPQAKREYVSGETLDVWGRQYRLAVEYGSRNSLVLSGDKALLTVRKGSSAAQREAYVREWYRGQLKAETERALPAWEKTTGLRASGWQTKNMKTRWGTCNTQTKKIWLNLQLAKKPPECLEYVILHELMHLIEKKHSRRFAGLMDHYMPMWREVKATLNS